MGLKSEMHRLLVALVFINQPETTGQLLKLLPFCFLLLDKRIEGKLGIFRISAVEVLAATAAHLHR